MFLTRKHLSRRTFLKGAGVSLGLPLLDAMIPAGTALAQTAAARKLRVGFFYLPHGAIMGNTALGPQMDRWTPSGSGTEFKLNAITKPLEPYKKYVTSLGNIKNDAWSGTQHILNPATWLSGMRPANLSFPSMSATLDQVIAGTIGSQVPVRSLQVASERTVQAEAVTRAPYTTLSFSDPTTPLPMEFNPKEVFLKLFGAPHSEVVFRETASLLDLIREQTLAMQRDLSPGDRAVLDDHLTAVREAEVRLNATKRELGDVKLPPMPEGLLDDFDRQVDLMFELIGLAFQTDMTRVVSFAMAAERTNRTYPHIGVPDSFHPVSHHANAPERIEKLVKIQTWHMERFADFLGKLASIPDGEGTLLDNVMFLYGSNMSNSDTHSSHPLPTLLVGGAAGKLAGGRHIELPERTPIANLHLSMLELAGIERAVFGDSTGKVSL